MLKEEVELESGCDPEILSIKDYNLEIELNSVKSRVGVYINKSVEYMRMSNLEGVNSHIVIIDIPNCSIKRIINVYRSFNPQNNVNAREKFKYQLEIIKKAMTERCIVIGDFNIDYAKIFDVNYGNKGLFEDFEAALSKFELVQLVNFITWSRMVGTSLRTSILDHIYIKDPTILCDLGSIDLFLPK